MCQRNYAKCLVHVNASMAILYVYVPVTWIVAWHIFRDVARSRQWNYLHLEHNLSYLEINCARWNWAKRMRTSELRIDTRALRKITHLRVSTLDCARAVHLHAYKSWRRYDENDCLTANKILLDIKLISLICVKEIELLKVVAVTYMRYVTYVLSSRCTRMFNLGDRVSWFTVKKIVHTQSCIKTLQLVQIYWRE